VLKSQGGRGSLCSKDRRGLTQNDEHLDQVDHLEQDEKVDHLDPLDPLKHINLLKVIKMIIKKGQVECELPVRPRRHLD